VTRRPRAFVLSSGPGHKTLQQAAPANNPARMQLYAPRVNESKAMGEYIALGRFR